jgi:eukaryotic-like serine/threonine-protein kinase
MNSIAPRRADLAPGIIVGGKYAVERIVGSGGMGIVAKAYDTASHRRVAIKTVAPDTLLNPDVVQRFMREARSVSRIRGDHVARIFDVGVFEEGAPYMVLEYLEGIDLQKYLAKHGPLAVVHVVRFVLEACEALAEAHAAKIVHRDLKPANLFLARTAKGGTAIKVLDFGVSKLLDDPMTSTMQMLGTAMYMSPEQLRSSKQVDERADIWALGVIMYELLVGKTPFAGKTMYQIAQSILANELTPLRSVRPDVSVDLERAIMQCLRSDPAERTGSVLELARALEPMARKRDRRSVQSIALIAAGASPASCSPESLATDSISAKAAELFERRSGPPAEAAEENLSEPPRPSPAPPSMAASPTIRVPQLPRSSTSATPLSLSELAATTADVVVAKLRRLRPRK